MYSDDDYYEDEYSGYGHTGDPVQDRLDYAVPDQVKKFLQYFQDMIKEGNVYEVNSLYENSFPKLTEQYFKVEKEMLLKISNIKQIFELSRHRGPRLRRLLRTSMMIQSS